MHVHLACEARLCNSRIQFPPDALQEVVVSCSDYHTHTVVRLEQGRFTVDFDLTSVDEIAPFRDTLKFHFFVGEDPVLVASGFIPFEDVLLNTHVARIDCNYSNNTIVLKSSPVDKESAYKQYQEMKPRFAHSALRDTELAVKLFQSLGDSLSKTIHNTMTVPDDVGGHIFTKIVALHCMDGQLTTDLHMQGDMQHIPRVSRLWNHSGISMTSIADTMHFMALTFEDVMALEGVEFTRFSTQVFQFAQRSAHLTPYTFDYNVCEELDQDGHIQLKPSEAFKRPFFEPFRSGKKGKNGPLMRDDCEGYAEFLNQTFLAYVRLYEETQGKIPPDMSIYFPSHMFDIDDDGKTKLFTIALRIGEDGSKGLIRSYLTLITSEGKRLNCLSKKKSVEAHACQTFQSWHNCSDGKSTPEDIIAEGTNCIESEGESKLLRVPTPNGMVEVSLADIANHVSIQLLEKSHKENKRLALHLVQAQHLNLPFYLRAFNQGDMLLGSYNSNSQMELGIPCKDLSCYSKKIAMPITGKLLDTIYQQGAAEWLRNHCKSRQVEIHTPPTSLENIKQAIQHWAPSTFYTGDPALKGRKYTNCVVSEAFMTREEQILGLQKALEEAKLYNETHRDAGHMRAWAGMDSVYTCISLWTDNPTRLQETVSDSICDLMKVPRMDRGEIEEEIEEDKKLGGGSGDLSQIGRAHV